MKNIVFSSSTAWYIFNFRKNTVLEMLESGYNVFLVSPEDEYVERLVRLGVKHINISLDRGGVNPLNDLKTICKYYSIYRKIKPDFIFNFTPKCNIYSTISGHFFTENIFNNISGLGSAFTKKNFVYYITFFLYYFSQKFSKKIFFQNEQDRRLFIENRIVAEEKTLRIPGSGVDLNRFHYTERSFDGGPTRFLFCGRLLYSKGAKLYVESAKILKNVFGENVNFSLLGFIDEFSKDAISSDELTGWIRSGEIDFLGKTDDVAPILREHDCIVLPSYYPEGVPKSLLEAASSGLAIITTDNVGCRDTVVDGENGYLVDKKSKESLVDAMTNYILLSNDDKRKMSLYSRKHIENNFDERIVIKMYMDLLS
ncbi:hypothetical protein ATY36_18035 [Vibrio cidicii]|uniref:glycosyltransferase family 4 protein n=1 Tax=Vibrio cidicii TaxID=1763883 RepID=UPI00077FF845|nr:glycosyltransferase family 4 protein [Vibrio cidicii]KYN80531.1 hypothetical protein ATY36_18035 [Vibrio cidicii]